MAHTVSVNKYVKFRHFKMDTIWTVIQMMTPGCYMASIDLKDGDHSVHIDDQHQKYLKFSWKDNLYQFTCFPNGLAFCPRKFTKLLKPVYSTLRMKGHLSVGYVDDSYYRLLISHLVCITLLTQLRYLIFLGLLYALKDQFCTPLNDLLSWVLCWIQQS